jgi:hypothetical protein
MRESSGKSAFLTPESQRELPLRSCLDVNRLFPVYCSVRLDEPSVRPPVPTGHTKIESQRLQGGPRRPQHWLFRGHSSQWFSGRFSRRRMAIFQDGCYSFFGEWAIAPKLSVALQKAATWASIPVIAVPTTTLKAPN